MQSLDEKKTFMTELIDSNDLDFSDWENFTDDIDIASLEDSLQIIESLNDNPSFPTESEFHSETTRNIFMSLRTSDAIRFNGPDNLQSKVKRCCDAKDQKLVAQEYPNCKEKNAFTGWYCDRQKKNKESQILTGYFPSVSRLEDLCLHENGVSTQGSGMMVSRKMIPSNQINISNEYTSCKNSTPLKENLNSERIIFPSEENLDSQNMIISSQESLDSQRMILSSQETSDSQRMIISSQESSGSEKMIISSQEFSDSQKMIISSQEFTDSQKMIISSQDSLDDQKIIILSHGSFGNQKIIKSSQDSSSCPKMIIFSQSFDSKNLISNQFPEDQKLVPSSRDTSVGSKMFNSKSGSFSKISEKINLKEDSKSYQSIGSRLSLKDKRFHKFLDFKSLKGVMTAQEMSPPANIAKTYGNIKKRKIVQIKELKVRKIETGMNKHVSVREADSPKFKSKSELKLLKAL